MTTKPRHTNVITGASLARSPTPARSLGLIAIPTSMLVADELVQQIATAIGEFVIPARALRDFATAVALMTQCDPDEGTPASEIAEEGKQRLQSAAMTVERIRLERAIGSYRANGAIDDCVALGANIFAALGDRRVPTEARNCIAILASHIIDEKWGL